LRHVKYYKFASNGSAKMRRKSGFWTKIFSFFIFSFISWSCTLLIPLSLWLKKYAEISKFMGYEIAWDRKATKIFAEMLKAQCIKPPLNELRGLLSGRPAMIFGAGPSLDDSLDGLLRVFPNFSENFTLITADGATQALVEKGKIPHVIVTDLDGDMKSLLYSAERGSIVVIHAHGDNMERITRYTKEIISATKLIIGTTQVEPVPPLQNFGGFTDGDRAVFMASNYEAAPIILVGMDFGKVVGKRSKPWLRRDVSAWEDKLKKLEIAYELVSWLAVNFNSKIYTVSGNVPPGTRKICLEDINRIVKV